MYIKISLNNHTTLIIIRYFMYEKFITYILGNEDMPPFIVVFNPFGM